MLSEKIGAQIIKAGLLVSAAHLLFKIVGLLLTIVLGYYLDNRTFDIVYVVVFEGCILTVYFLFEEVVAPCLLPIFTREHKEKGKEKAWFFLSKVCVIQLVVLTLVVLALFSYPQWFILNMTSWDVLDERLKMGSHALHALAPSLIFLGMSVVTYMILNAHKQFLGAALADSAWKLSVVLFSFIGIGLWQGTYLWLIGGIYIGAIAKLVVHLFSLGKKCFYFRWKGPIWDVRLKEFFILCLPLLLGVIFARYRDIFNNVSVLSQIETDGLMKANSMGRKLYLAMGWLVPYAFSIVIFPYLCDLAGEKDRQLFSRVLTKGTRMLLALFIPIGILGVLLAEPITSLLFKGGEFDDVMVNWTAISLACYSLVLPAYSLEFVFMQAFFSKGKMMTVAVVGMVYSTLSVVISYIGIVILEIKEEQVALLIIGLGYTLSRSLKTLTLMLLLKRELPIFPILETAGFFLRVCLASLLMGLAIWWSYQNLFFGWPISTPKLKELSLLSVMGGIAIILYSLFSRVLGVSEVYAIFFWFRREQGNTK